VPSSIERGENTPQRVLSVKSWFNKWVWMVKSPKVGREQLSIILYDAFDALKPGGKITFVTINGLRHFIKDNFKRGSPKDHFSTVWLKLAQ
jgi:hypothetical protein